MVISALVVGWPGTLPLVARHLDHYGYARLWLTEHHAVGQSGSPLIAAAVAASTTTRIAVGTAGVMLRYTRALRIAKDAHLLELLYPGRVDIGTIGGSVGEAEVHRRLNVSQSPEWAEAYRELAMLIREPKDGNTDDFPPGLCRSAGTAPRLWVCSNRQQSAIFAGAQGVGLIFHIPQAGEDGIVAAAIAADAYRRAFVPSAQLAQPRVAVVCAGICAESMSAARSQWPRIIANSDAEFRDSQIARTIDGSAPPSHFFVGRADQCKEKLDEIRFAVGADELILHCASDSAQGSLRAHALMAQAFGLSTDTAPQL